MNRRYHGIETVRLPGDEKPTLDPNFNPMDFIHVPRDYTPPEHPEPDPARLAARYAHGYQED